MLPHWLVGAEAPVRLVLAARPFAADLLDGSGDLVSGENVVKDQDCFGGKRLVCDGCAEAVEDNAKSDLEVDIGHVYLHQKEGWWGPKPPLVSLRFKMSANSGHVILKVFPDRQVR